MNPKQIAYLHEKDKAQGGNPTPGIGNGPKPMQAPQPPAMINPIHAPRDPWGKIKTYLSVPKIKPV